MSKAILEARHIHKSFGPLEVLKGIDLSLNEGEVVSLIGASGSGKSTFLRCLNFLEQADRGEIVFEQQKVLSENLNAYRTQVGMVFQHFHLFPHMSVLANIIEAPVHVKKIPKAEAIANAHQLLEKVDLIDKKHEYPARLSGGQKQRVAIARALAMNPKVLLFDEPTSALDPETVESVLQVMRNLAQEGMTMIIVTHEMSFARSVSDRIGLLHEGQLVEMGPPEQLFERPEHERTRLFLKNFS